MKSPRILFSCVPVLLLALSALGSLSGCGENAITKATREQREKYAALDNDSLQAYLKRNKYTTYTRTDKGVFIVPLTPGTGSSAIVNGSQVRIQYVGRVLTVNQSYYAIAVGPVPGKVFDSSFDNRTACGCATFTVGSGLVSGFSEGLTYLRKGSRALLLIPSAQAYGPGGSSGSIYPDSSLLFDVTVLDVSP